MRRIASFLITAVIFGSVILVGCSAADKNLSAKKIKAPAFPGADGFGKYTVGGRGGKVYEVTNLNDSGQGTLREAIEVAGARAVVFRVSGNIELKSELRITNPYITIAGQTAPGDGICIQNYPLVIAADEIIIRFLRFRLGHSANQPLDCLTISGEGKNIIVDHCSASWSVDEVLSVANDPGGAGLPSPANVTIQWCIIAESLNKSVHPKGEHGYGTLAKGGWGNGYSFHHNLYAHNKARNPYPGNYTDQSIDPDGLIFDFRNNVIYNWGGPYAGYNTQSRANSITRMNFVGNYYKQGPNSTGAQSFMQRVTASKGYFRDNWMNGSCPDDPWSLVIFGHDWTDEQKADYKQSGPVPAMSVQMDDPPFAYQKVLAKVGAIYPVRDSVDRRIIEEVQNRTGRLINNEQDVGGWPRLNSLPAPADGDHDGMPDGWELEKGLNPKDGSDGAKDCDGDGYTNLEEYLNGICK